MNKYVDYLNYRHLQKKSEDIGNILRPLGAPRVQPAEAPVNYRDPVVPQSTPRPVAPQPTPQPTPQPVATPYRPPVATRLPSADPLNRNMSEAQRFANGFNGVKSSGLMDKIPAGVMTNDDFADKQMMDYNKGLPSATSPTYAPNVPWERMPTPTPMPAAPFDRAGIATQTQKPRDTGMLGDIVAAGGDRPQAQRISDKLNAIKSNIQAGMSPQPAKPLNFPVKPGLPTAMTNDDFADKEMMDYNKGLPSATSPTYAPKPMPTPTPMPAAPVLPKPLGAKIGQERQSKLNRYIKALELLNS